jgi:hypothetical protein
MKLETDINGKIITKPIIEWTTATLANIVVLLAIQYSDRPEEIEAGPQVQLVLTPQECLVLAEALTKQAKRILEPKKGRPPS